MLDFDRLTQDIAAAAERALQEAVARSGAPLAGFALCSDAGAMEVSPAFNTWAHLKQQADDDPQDAVYYRWSPGEWGLESFGVAHFGAVNERVRQAVAEVSPQRFAEFRARLFQACVVALTRVRQQTRFASALRGAAVVFSVCDMEDPPAEKTWIEALNTPQDAQEFSRWLDGLPVRGS
jgi:hypothetical protein